MTATYWNGERTPARQVDVIVGEGDPNDEYRHSKWWLPYVGQVRPAVEVTYCGQVFFLDDADGQGWFKVTEGRGSPRCGHSSLPDDSTVVLAL